MRAPYLILVGIVGIGRWADACGGVDNNVSLFRERYPQGTFVGSVAAAGFAPIKSDRDISVFALDAGLGHYFRDRFGLFAEFGVFGANGTQRAEPATAPEGSDSYGIRGSAQLRWHFAQGRYWSAFADYGFGVLLAEDEFPAGGTRANYTMQYGLGATRRLSARWDLVLGLREIHVSNGRGLVEDNPSYDGVGAYAGASWRISPGAGEAASRTRRPSARAPARAWTARVEGQSEPRVPTARSSIVGSGAFPRGSRRGTLPGGYTSVLRS